MRVLAIDPGATSGWCLYCSSERRVLAAGEFEVHRIPASVLAIVADRRVIEGFAAVHAGIYPQTVAAAWTGGRIVERWEAATGPVAELTRHEVKCALHDAIHGEFPVKKDRDVWAALLLLHGGELAAKKGGPLHGVKAHARAALAVAFVAAMREAAAAREVAS